MDEPQKPLSPRYEAFAQLMAAGNMTAADAYAQTYPKASKATANTTGPKVLRMPAVAQRVAELQAEVAARGVRTAAEVAEFCERVIFSPLSVVDENSDLCQEFTRDTLETGGSRGRLRRGDANEGNEESSPPATVIRTKIKMPSKLDAVEKLAKLRGWYQPDRLQLGVDDTLQAWISKQRKRAV